MSRRLACAVIGAANVDIGGFPRGRLALGDSNPGRIAVTAGGVGRNIACNLALLGAEVELVTALGGDQFAETLRADCARMGVGLAMARTFRDSASSAYLYIADESGDMRAAVNDMEICARLTPEAIEPLLSRLNGMAAVVADANLPAETLTFLAGRLTVPLLADAVSAAKAARLRGALPRLAALKANRLEAEALLGRRGSGPEDALAAARALADAGVRRVYVTLGAAGVCCADSSEAIRLPCVPARAVNATGAGDAFAAALAWSEMKGLSLRESARAGLAAASVALEGEAAVNPALNEQEMIGRMAVTPSRSQEETI